MSGSVPDADLEQGFGLRLLRNLAVQSGSQAVVIVLGLITTYVLARQLGPEAWGGFNYLFAYIYIFLALNDLGITYTLIREVAQTPSRTAELVQNMLGLKLVLSVVSVLVGWLVVALLPLPAAYKLAVRVFLLILPVQAFTTPAVILQARLQVGRGTIVDMANRLTGFTLMMLAVWAGHGLLFVTLSLVCGEIVGALAIIGLTFRAAKPWPRCDLPVWTRMIRLSLPLSGTSLLVAMLNRFDSLMLQALGDLTQVGYYGAAYRLPNLFERVPQLAMTTLFPVMSRLAVSDPRALRRVYRRMQRLMALLVVPMVISVMWLAPFIVRVWLGPKFAPVAPLMRVVILASALVYVGISAGNLLIALSRPKANLYAMAAAAAVNLTLNFLWIPRYRAMGAAWATVIAFGVLSGAGIVMAELALRRAIQRHEHLSAPVAPAAAGEGLP